MTSCAATAISQSGIVAGYCYSGAGSLALGAPSRGFVYSRGTLTDMGPGPRTGVVPTAVNDSGVVIGDAVDGTILTNFNYGAVVYQNGALKPLTAALPNFVPFGLTNSGLIAGFGSTTRSDLLESIFSGQAITMPLAGGKATALPAIGGPQTVAFGISPSGEWVAGASANGDGTVVKPTLWRNGAAVALPLLLPFEAATATFVTDSGMAAGVAFHTRSAQARAVRFESGAVVDLGLLPGDTSSLAIGINSAGQVVGYGTSEAGTDGLQLLAYIFPAGANYRAFLHSGGKLHPLTSLVVNGAGWQLSYATGINNAGQIIGTGLYQGQQRAFLLTPVAPPRVASIAGAGLSVPSIKSLSPNGLFTLFGSGFAAEGVSRSVATSDLTGAMLPLNLANTCIQSGTTRWPLTYVSSTQINAIAGSLPVTGTVPLSVVRDCGLLTESVSAAVSTAVAIAAPEFLYFVQHADGRNPVAAIQAKTGAYVGPQGLIPGATFTPARAGDVLTVFGVGWGETDPPVSMGMLAPVAAALTARHSLTVGGVPAVVKYAGLTPTYAGLYQVNFVVPPGVAAGDQPLILTLDGVASSGGAFLAVTDAP